MASEEKNSSLVEKLRELQEEFDEIISPADKLLEINERYELLVKKGIIKKRGYSLVDLDKAYSLPITFKR